MRLNRYILALIIALAHFASIAKPVAITSIEPPVLATPATISQFVDANIFKKLILLRDVDNLNDILLYEYVQEYAKTITEDNHFKQLISGYIMGELGYDVIIAGNKEELGVYAYSNSQVYDKNFVRFDSKKYFLISASSNEIQEATSLAMLTGFKKGNKSFCFTCNDLPEYSEYTEITTTLEFKNGNKHYKYRLSGYKEVVDMYNKQPNLGLSHIFSNDFKGTAVNQLVTLIKKDVRKMNTEEGISLILSLTRTAFNYKADQGTELYLNPEQTLFSTYSDCEDRAALAFYLIKEIYDLPLAVVQFKGHVGLAVQLNHSSANQNIINDGLAYSYIEATGPDNSLLIGEMPNEVMGQSYTISLTYHP